MNSLTAKIAKKLLPCKKKIKGSIEQNLNFLCPRKKYQSQYAKEAILTLRGWAGVIHSINKEPHLLQSARKITLDDFLAVKLCLERAWIESENISKKIPLFKMNPTHLEVPKINQEQNISLRFCQEILEKKNFEKVLINIKTNKTVNESSHYLYQAIFCMDDRECGLRRNLENISQEIQTFGTAGHFGIECFFLSARNIYPQKQCPLPIAPKVLITESTITKKIKKRSYLNIRYKRITNNLKLFLKLFTSQNGKRKKNIFHKNSSSKINLIRTNEQEIYTHHHFVKAGYTSLEMAQIVYEQLFSIGITQNLASQIYVIGHGSQSENNPYFTAYGCGACSGRPGGVNAKIFVTMANNLEVRNILKSQYGFEIPQSTIFIAGQHDTCRDSVTFFDTQHLNIEHKKQLSQFQKIISQACLLNAEERAQLFPNINLKKFDPLVAPQKRASSFYETRPEMGHTNVQFAVVGRRILTQGLNLNRSAFMQSYDPTLDQQGNILKKILTAVVPVCSGISLDYFFSRVDNLRFGAGSKLPQNIVGNIGTSHGTESDLLFGLPIQMVDQHTPLRLVIIVEQKPDIALEVLNHHPLVYQIVHNQWVYYFSYDWTEKKFYLYHNNQMMPYQFMDQHL